MRAAAAVGARVGLGDQRARADPAHRLERGVEDLLQARVEVLGREPVGADAGQAGVGAVAQQSARAAVVVAAQRLIQAADRLELEQVRKREQVQPDLQPSVVEPW